MNWLVRCLTRLGFTRDMFTWLWLRIVSAATLVTANVIDVNYWGSYLGLNVTPKEVHWITVIATAILWIAGKQDRSWLPSTEEKQSVKLPKAS